MQVVINDDEAVLSHWFIKSLSFISGVTLGFTINAGFGGIGIAFLPLFLLLFALILARHGRIKTHGMKNAIGLAFLASVLIFCGLALSSMFRGNIELLRVVVTISQYAFALLVPLLVFSMLNRGSLLKFATGYVIGGFIVAILSVVIFIFFNSLGRSLGWIWVNGRLEMWSGANGFGPHMIYLTIVAVALTRYASMLAASMLWICVIVFGMAASFTGSNTTIIIFAAAITTISFFSGDLVKVLKISAVVFIGFFTFTQLIDGADASVVRVFDRFSWISMGNISSAGTFNQRLEMIILGWSYILDNPFLGFGANAGQDKSLFHDHQPHNVFVLIWVEGGIFAIMGIVLWLFSVVAAGIGGSRALWPVFFSAVLVTGFVMSMRPHSYQLWLTVPAVLLATLAVKERAISTINR